MSSGTSDLRERRLRPVYDAIDNGQYKQSLQLCNKLLLKKQQQHEDQAIVKALMGLTLVRMDKRTEALQCAEEARSLKPTDEETLQALTFTYKPMQRRTFT
jgi:N-terminal acetyltransferase B complex non-catalytic subunit